MKRLLCISIIFTFLLATTVDSGILRSSGSSFSRPLKTGQTISYATGDDGDLELGLSRSYTVLTTGAQSGNTTITVDGVTHNTANAVVVDRRTRLIWLREVIVTDIGPTGNGQFFWEGWEITGKTDISFTAGTKTINSVAGDFSTDALCSGRKFIIAGTDSNDGTYTVDSISANNIVTVEALQDEAAGDTVSVTTTGGTIWDLLAAVNAAGVGGYSDWRIPNYLELPTIVDLGEYNPCIDTTAFPSTPSSYHWTSSTRPDNTTSAFIVHFNYGYVSITSKQTGKYYVRFVRG